MPSNTVETDLSANRGLDGSILCNEYFNSAEKEINGGRGARPWSMLPYNVLKFRCEKCQRDCYEFEDDVESEGE